ncbi:hypothetical protein [Thiothrix nivea]|uniref:Uncharacterized protein n=1 Tax=Thiothrix nivea (strain ATCC 35100 / DSM 5205 / JP2) TaxID=870187 RepID=A0A656HF81_THINJ|nr:hypothetical protein [Thiothrix nivea]EIJ35731.1 hypothetical protein Thini_3210 [Thiothrix nivea DSM 5205]
MQNSIIGLRLPPDLKREFADIASQQNTTMSVLTRGLINNFIKKHRKQNRETANP